MGLSNHYIIFEPGFYRISDGHGTGGTVLVYATKAGHTIGGTPLIKYWLVNKPAELGGIVGINYWGTNLNPRWHEPQRALLTIGDLPTGEE